MTVGAVSYAVVVNRFMNVVTDSIAVLILAAGASRRLGEPKALLRTPDGRNLIQKVANTALSAGAGDVYVIVQPDDHAVRTALKDTSAHCVPNRDWQDGMSTSIRCGISQIISNGRSDGVLILLVDQPELNGDILRSMMAAFAGGQRIVACHYDDVIGVPALIGTEFLNELMDLTGDQGARDWLRERAEQVVTIPFPGGARDIDTAADSRSLEND